MDVRDDFDLNEEDLLLAWDGVALIETNAGPSEARARFEAVFRIRGDHPTRRGIQLARFSLAAASVEAASGPTGVFTVVGLSGHGVVRMAERRSPLRLELECRVNYESLDRAAGVDVEAPCYYLPAWEPAAASLEGELLAEKDDRRLDVGRLRVVCAAGDFGEVQAIQVDLERAPLRRIVLEDPRYRLGGRGEWDPLDDENTDANVCIQVNRRGLVIQPVGFRSSASDTSPSGSTAAAQFGAAQAVWGKSCIDLEVRPTVLITDATLKTSSNLTAIRNSYTDADPAVIEVFFVENSLPAVGGGQAGGIGVASCKPVIAEPNGGNPVLTAHEFGHVLGLLHPGAGSNSDQGTVMAPTGSAMSPGTQLVTHFMCTNITNPVLQTLAALCCLTHDIGNHYIRDFPVDVGSEPSEPLPAGMNRYAMSNVWNRRTNTPGTASASTGPAHEQPVRFNSDLTPRTNYLFARVEQTVNLQVRNAVVKFFRKNPGSGGGASNLLFLGQVPVPPTLAVGVPETISLPWTVPTGTPAHSCLFAVVRSDAEQEGDQSALDWWQFEDLSRLDNDWAQRNLDIEDFASGNVGDSNVIEGAPALIYLPPPRDRKGATLVLDVDTQQAADAKLLTLEVVGEKATQIKPGGRVRIRLGLERRRGPVVVIASATVPGGLELGQSLSVAINPSIDGRPMAGFASTFRVARTRDVVAQVADVATAAFTDLAEFVDFPGADDLVCGLGDYGRCPPLTTRRLAARITDAKGALRAARPELSRLPALRQVDGKEALARCLSTIDSFEREQTSPDELVSVFRGLCNRLLVAANVLIDSARPA
jgi:hypothetical protein